MLLDYGADVTMQDRPDLAAVLKGEIFYAEVKHFNRKAQDDLNDQAARNAPELEFVRLEDPTRTEGKSAYQQIADVAIRKADQYREGEINILIIDSDSETLHLMARSGAQEFSDDKEREAPESPLDRLNGIMLIDRWCVFAEGRGTSISRVHLAEFELRGEVCRLVSFLDVLKEGTIQRLGVRAGVRHRLVFESRVSKLLGAGHK